MHLVVFSSKMNHFKLTRYKNIKKNIANSPTLPEKKICVGHLFCVVYTSQLKAYFFLKLDCLLQGNTRAIPTKRCTGLLVVIGIYLNRFD